MDSLINDTLDGVSITVRPQKNSPSRLVCF